MFGIKKGFTLLEVIFAVTLLTCVVLMVFKGIIPFSEKVAYLLESTEEDCLVERFFDGLEDKFLHLSNGLLESDAFCYNPSAVPILSFKINGQRAAYLFIDGCLHTGLDNKKEVLIEGVLKMGLRFCFQKSPLYTKVQDKLSCNRGQWVLNDALAEKPPIGVDVFIQTKRRLHFRRILL